MSEPTRRLWDENPANFIDDPIRVGVEWPVVDQMYRDTVRYPKPLMPVSGIRVAGYTIHLNLQRSDDPKATAICRRLLQLCSDSIQQIIGNIGESVTDLVGVSNSDLTHDDSSLLSGDGTLTSVDDPSIQGSLDGEGGSSSLPPAPPGGVYEFIDIAPGCFAALTPTGTIISWQGVNYIKQPKLGQGVEG